MMYLLRAFSLPKWSLNLDKTLNNFETEAEVQHMTASDMEDYLFYEY